MNNKQLIEQAIEGINKIIEARTAVVYCARVIALKEDYLGNKKEADLLLESFAPLKDSPLEMMKATLENKLKENNLD